MWVSGDRTFRTKLLPKRIIWPTGAAVLALYVVAGIVEAEPSRILAARRWAGASCGAIFFIIYYLYPEGMGFGDVRLVTINGVAVGLVRHFSRLDQPGAGLFPGVSAVGLCSLSAMGHARA